MSQDKLHSIAPEHWPELRDLFKYDWPRNEVPFNTIQNYINWMKIDARIKQLEFLSLNDNWRENGTYIIIDRYYMFFHTLEKSNDSLRRALWLVDWDYSYRISQIHESCQPALDEVIQVFKIELQLYNQTVLYKFPKEESLKLEHILPEGFYTKKLESTHAVKANEVWPHRCEGSEYTLKRLAAWNPSIGLFNASDELLAWCMCWTTGAIAALQVDKEHLRKGYGSIVVKAIAKEMALLGMNCYASVHPYTLRTKLNIFADRIVTMVLTQTLEAIPPQDWPSLRDVFKREWPRHQLAYNTVQNYINWINIDPQIKQLQMFSLNDDSWKDNGTCIILDRYQMFAYTLETSNDSLKRALLQIDWDYSYKIVCISDNHRAAFEETFETLSIELLWDHPCVLYELPREECLELELNIPEGLHVKKLELDHAITANQIWPHRCEGSEYFLKRLAAWNPSVGLFNEAGELMAWSFCWPNGAIGPLEVVSEHYRKGYGTIVTKAIAKEMAKVGLNCYGTATTGNVRSRGMLEKIGFKLMGGCFYARNRARKLVEYGQ